MEPEAVVPAREPQLSQCYRPQEAEEARTRSTAERHAQGCPADPCHGNAFRRAEDSGDTVPMATGMRDKGNETLRAADG